MESRSRDYDVTCSNAGTHVGPSVLCTVVRSVHFRVLNEVLCVRSNADIKTCVTREKISHESPLSLTSSGLRRLVTVNAAPILTYVILLR